MSVVRYVRAQRINSGAKQQFESAQAFIAVKDGLAREKEFLHEESLKIRHGLKSYKQVSNTIFNGLPSFLMC